jgi:simple sugar transport system permease protein
MALRAALRQAAGAALILAITAAVTAALVLLLGGDGARPLAAFFLGPLRNRYAFGNMLNSAIPLIFGGLGISVALRGGAFNLGGEGQVYAGAFVTAAAALALEPLGPAGAVTALLAGTLFSGAVAGLSGLLLAKYKAGELITTFLISSVLILFINYGITGPFLDPASSLQTTRKIAEAWRLPRILPPSNLSAALFFALAAAALTHVFLSRTQAGYEIRLRGLNPVFARYGGIADGRNAVLALFISGALYGLGGGMAVYGTYYAAVKEFTAGMGWNSLAVALLARSRPAAVVPAAIAFAWIGSGARAAMQFSGASVELTSVIQSVVFFLVSSAALRDGLAIRAAARQRPARTP